MSIEESQQKYISGTLQLLSELGYSSADMSYASFKPKRYYNRKTRDENRILDTITVLLTSSRPDDATAAAFDKNQGLVLVLAKNRPPTDEDDKITRSLITTLMDPSTHSTTDLSHFLLSHCHEKMQKRISEAHQSLSDFYRLPTGRNSGRTHCKTALYYYQEESIEEEFPKLSKHPVGQDLPFRDVLYSLFERCIEESKFDLDPANLIDAMSRYKQLSQTAGILLHSRFLDVCSSPGSDPKEGIALKLRRRLAKVCLYYDGVNELIKAAKRLFHDNIRFRWAHDPLAEMGVSEVHLDKEYLTSLLCPYPVGSHTAPRLASMVERKCAGLTSNWEDWRHVTTKIHAEIRIILYFHSLSSSPSHVQTPIGCNKQTCLCCKLWIDTYNLLYRMAWITSGSHGKPSVDWALPDLVDTSGWFYQSFESKVADDTYEALENLLFHMRFR